METPTCFKCGAKIEAIDGKVGRRDTCSKCGSDSRVCRNCLHYDPKAYNECREPSAERVVEKDRSNFCDYFSLGGGAYGGSGDSRDSVLKKLDDLFKK